MKRDMTAEVCSDNKVPDLVWCLQGIRPSSESVLP